MGIIVQGWRFIPESVAMVKNPLRAIANRCRRVIAQAIDARFV